MSNCQLRKMEFHTAWPMIWECYEKCEAFAVQNSTLWDIYRPVRVRKSFTQKPHSEPIAENWKVAKPKSPRSSNSIDVGKRQGVGPKRVCSIYGAAHPQLVIVIILLRTHIRIKTRKNWINSDGKLLHGKCHARVRIGWVHGVNELSYVTDHLTTEWFINFCYIFSNVARFNLVYMFKFSKTYLADIWNLYGFSVCFSQKWHSQPLLNSQPERSAQLKTITMLDLIIKFNQGP